MVPTTLEHRTYFICIYRITLQELSTCISYTTRARQGVTVVWPILEVQDEYDNPRTDGNLTYEPLREQTGLKLRELQGLGCSHW